MYQLMPSSADPFCYLPKTALPMPVFQIEGRCCFARPGRAALSPILQTWLDLRCRPLLPPEQATAAESKRQVINVIGEIGSVPADERKNGRTECVHPV